MTSAEALRRALRDPLAQFLAAGAVLFAIFSAVDGAREEIRVSKALGERLYAEAVIVGGEERAVSPDALLEAWIDEEILFREALADGAHLSDAALRARLVELMRARLTHEPPAPNEAELRAFYAAHPEYYRTDMKATFDHAFFAEAPADADAVLAALEAGEVAAGAARFWLGDRLVDYDRAVLRQTFGVAFAEAVFEAPAGRWTGPIVTPRGAHFIRIESTTPERLLPFEQVREEAASDYAADARADELAEAVRRLRRKYRFVLED